MPQLVWNPVDFLDVLGVEPEVAEYDACHRYVVERPPLRLDLQVRQYDGDILLELFVASLEKPVVTYRLVGCPGVRLVTRPHGRGLEFAAANAFTGRYDGYSVIPYGLRLWIEPQIRLEPFTYPT